MTRHSTVFLIALSTACAAYAGDDLVVKGKASAAVVARGVGSSAQRVFLDPETGLPRKPTLEERQQLQQQHDAAEASKADATEESKASESPRVVHFPNGAVGVYGTKPKNMMQAEVSADGRVKTFCDDPKPHKVHP